MSSSEERKFTSLRSIFSSARSLSHYESKRFKTLIPQIIATGVVMCPNILVGITYGYSAIFVPQILAVQNSTDPDVIKVTQTEIAWIVSCVTLMTPFFAISGGFIMDAIGRLNLLKLVAIPSLIGWLLLAMATNVPMLICGRLISGIVLVWGANPASVYITEISRKDVRGTFTSTCSLGASIGMVVVYITGWYIDWRMVAWVNIGYTVVFLILLFLIPESPAWLVSKNRINQARKSLTWFHKYQPQPENQSTTFAEMQLTVLQKENVIKMKEREQLSKNGFVQKIKMFGQPSGYKPVLITSSLYFFQQFSGIHVIIFNGVIFFQEMGTSIDPFLATVYIGCMRLLMTLINTVLMKRFTRRSLMITSGITMAIFMSISGLYTKWRMEGTSTNSWIPLMSLMIYFIAAAWGFMTIPFSVQAEVFPLAVRGIAHAIVSSVANLMVFSALQCYFPFKELFGGSAGIQFFYATISLAGFVFVFVFMPETHNKKLSEIEAYFWKHTTYLSVSQHEDEPKGRTPQTVTSSK